MKIVSSGTLDPKAYGKSGPATIYNVHVKIRSINRNAKKIIRILKDTSWINGMGLIDRVSYEARAKATIKKLVNDIVKKVHNNVTSDFGEYLVTFSATASLKDVLNHNIVPLAELWNKKKSGNPGFDFHTETHTTIISFGEGKYKSTGTPYKEALEQIERLIGESKDLMDLSDLKHFASEKALKRATKNKKAYAAAFSLDAKNPDKIFENIMKSTYIDPLLKYPEVYLIAIEL